MTSGRIVNPAHCSASPMTEQIARIIVIVVASLGAITWYIGFRCYLHLNTLSQSISKEHIIKGVSIDQAIKSILKTIADNPAVHVTNRLDNAVSFRFRKMDIAARLSGASGGVRLETLVDPGPTLRGFRIAMSILVLIVVPLAILLVSGLIWTLVIPAQNPAIRWQVIQVVQMVHFLWPPFLIYGLARGQRTMGVRFADHLPLQVELSDA